MLCCHFRLNIPSPDSLKSKASVSFFFSSWVVSRGMRSGKLKRCVTAVRRSRRGIQSLWGEKKPERKISDLQIAKLTKVRGTSGSCGAEYVWRKMPSSRGQYFRCHQTCPRNTRRGKHRKRALFPHWAQEEDFSAD